MAAARRSGSCMAVAVQQLVQDARLDAVDAQPALEMARQGARPARMRHLGQHLFRRMCRQQIQRAWHCRGPQFPRAASATRHTPGCPRCRSLWRRTPPCAPARLPVGPVRPTQGHRLEGLARKPCQKCGLQPPARRSRSWLAAAAPHRRRARAAGAPRRRRSPAGPAATAQRQHHASARSCTSPAGIGETHTRAGGVIGPSLSQRWRMWNCTGTPVPPGWRSRCIQLRSSGAAFMSVGNTRPESRQRSRCPGPVPRRAPARPETLQQRSDLPLACTEPGYEALGRLGVRQVQAADTGQQELAPDRRHGVIHMHGHTCSRQHLCRHQAGRAPTNHCHGFHGEPISLDLPDPGRRRRSGRRRTALRRMDRLHHPPVSLQLGHQRLAAAAAAGADLKSSTHQSPVSRRRTRRSSRSSWPWSLSSTSRLASRPPPGPRPMRRTGADALRHLPCVGQLVRRQAELTRRRHPVGRCELAPLQQAVHRLADTGLRAVIVVLHTGRYRGVARRCVPDWQHLQGAGRARLWRTIGAETGTGVANAGSPKRRAGATSCPARRGRARSRTPAAYRAHGSSPHTGH
jgi:hypothetical protein